METISLYIAMALSVVVIVIVSTISMWQVAKAKADVKDELTKFATLVNDAHYNEYVFDKMNEQNIKNMDVRLNDVDERLNYITNTPSTS